MAHGRTSRAKGFAWNPASAGVGKWGMWGISETSGSWQMKYVTLVSRAGAPAYSRTTRGKYSDTTQFGISTMELMRRSAQTLHNM